MPNARPLSSVLLSAVMLTAVLTLLMTQPAAAVVVELDDVASDRIERQLNEAVGQIPLPGTPNLAQFAERLQEKNLSLGGALFIRVFKAESELEVWMRRDDRFVLFATYPICNWSGTIGPKINEGDKQTPEGIYTVSSRQLHMVGRHPRSLNLGFPNAFDKQYNRTGSYILIHGGCSTVGCFAMTNPVIEEIFSLSSAALKAGQETIQVQVFPFRMTETRLNAYARNEWYPFWRNLKDAYDSFERNRIPPKVAVCEGRYLVEDSQSAAEVVSHGPLASCGAPIGEASRGRARERADLDVDPSYPPQSYPPQSYPPLTTLRPQIAGLPEGAGLERLTPIWMPVAVAHPSSQLSLPSAPLIVHPRSLSRFVQARAARQMAILRPQQPGPSHALSQEALSPRGNRARSRLVGSLVAVAADGAVSNVLPKGTAVAAMIGSTPPVQISCNLSLTSCRKHVALLRAAVRQQQLAEQKASLRAKRQASSGRGRANGS